VVLQSDVADRVFGANGCLALHAKNESEETPFQESPMTFLHQSTHSILGIKNVLIVSTGEKLGYNSPGALGIDAGLIMKPTPDYA
jgi:hypothetical protein